jgi:hypothetical protein
MAHFAAGEWCKNYGPIPYALPLSGFSKSVAVLNNTVSTNQGATEGTDLATFTAPDAGMYRVSVYMAVNVASDATTETIAPVISFTDAVGAKSNVALMSGATQATVNAKTSGAQGSWTGQLRALAGGSIAVKVQNVITSAGRTVGSINWSVVVEKIGE